MKNYNQLTREFLQSTGQKRVKVADAATGELRIRNVNERQYKALLRSGRKFEDVGS